MDKILPHAHNTEKACTSHRFVTELMDHNFLYKAAGAALGVRVVFMMFDYTRY
jgi:hypothetical protein